MDTEGWRDIHGYEGRYRVSTEGRVISVAREINFLGRPKMVEETVMRQYDHWRGYKIIFLNTPGERRKKFFVHRLVAQAFIENPLNLPIVNHKDGNRQHNRLSNLEWTDESGNMQDRFRRAREAAAEKEPF